MDNVKIERIEWARLTGERPRKAGCNSRLGEHGRIQLLHALQQPQGMKIPCTGPNLGIEARNRLEIVVEHVRP